MATASPPSEPKTSKPVLLIVDDEEGPRQSLRIVFNRDYRVFLATGGDEALEIVRREPVDVAILDIMMAGMSGVELLGKLKEHDKRIEVIMLTAFETLDTARQALRFGASDYLNKPFDIPTMRKAVAGAVEKRRVAMSLGQTDRELAQLRNALEEGRVREEIIRSKGDIYASVLHDINSPLTVISGFVELLNASLQSTGRVEGRELDAVREDLAALSTQVTRCFEISRRYLSFLRDGERGSGEAASTQILTDLRDLLTRHPAARGQQLMVHGPDEEITVRMNGTDLLQILLNLTINALQCTDTPHKVDVSVHLLPGALRMEEFVDGESQRFINRDTFPNKPNLAAICVRDNGPGITPEVMQKLFDQQLTTKAADKGTGLGLSIVKRLSRSAGAAVHVRTRLGSGSSFTLFVPVA